MTFTYVLPDSREYIEIYDHKDNLIQTVQNDGSGIELPTVLFDVMRSEAEKARADGDTERWRDIHIRLATNDIAPRE